MRLFVGVFLGAAFFGVSPVQDNASDAKVFCVGAILPLTGSLSEYGVAFSMELKCRSWMIRETFNK